MFDRKGKMDLHTRWENFAHAHNLEAGCLPSGRQLVFVKLFDKISCRRHYHTGESSKDTDS